FFLSRLSKHRNHIIRSFIQQIKERNIVKFICLHGSKFTAKHFHPKKQKQKQKLLQAESRSLHDNYHVKKIKKLANNQNSKCCKTSSSNGSMIISEIISP
ncbi:hypothetical protein PanWU01x14_151400, partial [Parasponia andersonii]